MNGDEIRATRFAGARRGYDVAEVDGLLDSVAAEFDGGRPAGPLIENAAFRTGVSWGYDIDSVDWFLEQLMLSSGRSELAGMSSGLWRDLPAAQVIQGPGREVTGWDQMSRFGEECANAWRDFGQHPGTYLRWQAVKSSGKPRRFERQLQMADQRPIASVRSRPGSWVQIWPVDWTFCTSGSSFTVSTPYDPRSTADSLRAGIADVAAHSWRDFSGHFAAVAKNSRRLAAHDVLQLADETGTPILYFSGRNFANRACSRITFPDGRWLRFLVRGTKRGDAIMTAVDQAGCKVARYRALGWNFWERPVEIAVHPDRKLTDELILAIALSNRWLITYFEVEQAQ